MWMRESSNSLCASSTYTYVRMIDESSVTIRLFAMASSFPLFFMQELSLTDQTPLCAFCLYFWRMLCFFNFWRVRSQLSSSIWQSLMVLVSNLFSTLSCLLAENNFSASFLKQSSSLLSTHISSFSFFQAIFLFNYAANCRTSLWASSISSRTISNTSSSWRVSFFSMWACTSSIKELIFWQVDAIYYSFRCRAGFTISSKKLMNLLPIEFFSSAPKAKEDQGLLSSLLGLMSGLRKSINQIKLLRLNYSQRYSLLDFYTINYSPSSVFVATKGIRCQLRQQYISVFFVQLTNVLVFLKLLLFLAVFALCASSWLRMLILSSKSLSMGWLDVLLPIFLRMLSVQSRAFLKSGLCSYWWQFSGLRAGKQTLLES